MHISALVQPPRPHSRPRGRTAQDRESSVTRRRRPGQVASKGQMRRLGFMASLEPQRQASHGPSTFSPAQTRSPVLEEGSGTLSWAGPKRFGSSAFPVWPGSQTLYILKPKGEGCSPIA